MRWGENETLEFAKIYIRHHILWNRRHTQYKTKHLRLKAYKELIAEFYNATGIKLNEVEAKVKIKSLRSTYSQELQKIRNRSNEGWTFTPSLKWFQEWDKAFNSVNKTKCDFDDDNGDFENEHETSEPCQEIFMVSASDPNNTDPFTEPDEDYKLLVLKPEPNESTSKDITNRTKKKKSKRHSVNSFNRQSRYSCDSSSESNKEDEFDIYGKYIATQLRKMELSKALRVQLEIQNLVSEARLSDIVMNN